MRFGEDRGEEEDCPIWHAQPLMAHSDRRSGSGASSKRQGISKLFTAAETTCSSAPAEPQLKRSGSRGSASHLFVARHDGPAARTHTEHTAADGSKTGNVIVNCGSHSRVLAFSTFRSPRRQKKARIGMNCLVAAHLSVCFASAPAPPCQLGSRKDTGNALEFQT